MSSTGVKTAVMSNGGVTNPTYHRISPTAHEQEQRF